MALAGFTVAIVSAAVLAVGASCGADAARAQDRQVLGRAQAGASAQQRALVPAGEGCDEAAGHDRARDNRCAAGDGAAALRNISFTSVDATVLPAANSAHIVQDTARDDFPASPANSSIFVTVDAAKDDGAAVEKLRKVAGVDGIESALPPRVLRGRRPLVDQRLHRGVALRGLLNRRRATSCADSTGRARRRLVAQFVDQRATILDRDLPLALLIIAITFIVLFLMTGSVILPIKTFHHEHPHARRHFRTARADLPGRPPRRLARLHEPERARDDAARVAVRDRLRACDRLRRLPAWTDQGAARRRHGKPRSSRAWAFDDGARSSPLRRCCSASRSSPSAPHRSSSSRSSASVLRWPSRSTRRSSERSSCPR